MKPIKTDTHGRFLLLSRLRSNAAPRRAHVPALRLAPSCDIQPTLAGSAALSTVCCVIGACMLSMVIFDDEQWTHVESVGGVMFCLLAIACGAWGLHALKPARAAAVLGISMAGIALAFCLTNL